MLWGEVDVNNLLRIVADDENMLTALNNNENRPITNFRKRQAYAKLAQRMSTEGRHFLPRVVQEKIQSMKRCSRALAARSRRMGFIQEGKTTRGEAKIPHYLTELERLFPTIHDPQPYRHKRSALSYQQEHMNLQQQFNEAHQFMQQHHFNGAVTNNEQAYAEMGDIALQQDERANGSMLYNHLEGVKREEEDQSTSELLGQSEVHLLPDVSEPPSPTREISREEALAQAQLDLLVSKKRFYDLGSDFLQQMMKVPLFQPQIPQQGPAEQTTAAEYNTSRSASRQEESLAAAL